MTTLMKESTMALPHRDCDGGFANLTGSDSHDRTRGGRVRCILQIARTNLPVDLPAEVLESFRLLGSAEVTLQVPGEQLVHVTSAAILTQSQQRSADRWIAEMEDFDRF